jgi:hypothetical protein
MRIVPLQYKKFPPLADGQLAYFYRESKDRFWIIFRTVKDFQGFIFDGMSVGDVIIIKDGNKEVAPFVEV